MNQKVTIKTLHEQLTSELQQRDYSSGTIQLYKEHVNQLQRYMSENNILFYSPAVADDYYKEVLEPCDNAEHTNRFYRTVIRRLNDLYSGRGFLFSVPRKDITVPTPFQPVSSAYLSYCSDIGNSVFTLKVKKRALYIFLTALESLGCHNIEGMCALSVANTALMINEYELYPEIRDFMRYLHASGHVDKDYSTLIPKSQRGFRIPTTFTVQEVAKVEHAVDVTVPPGKRNYAILLLASRLGIRAGDIAALEVCNIDFDNDRIRFIQCKTGNVSDLYMIPEIKSALLDYISNERPDSSSNCVFLKSCAPHEGISYSVVSFTVKKYMKLSGIDITEKKHGPHSLRSSLATLMVNDGVDYDSVRKVLGHGSANTIKHYAKLDISMLRQCSFIEGTAPNRII